MQGKHAQGSGGEAAADIYRQAAAGDPGPSGASSLPSSGAVLRGMGAGADGKGRQQGVHAAGATIREAGQHLMPN